MKKLFLGIGAAATALAVLPLFAAFEAHVINVSAKIENALFVHPESLEYGTVFPQEHLNSSFFLAFSQSFSEASQRRVGRVDYVIKQKPKCGQPVPNTDPVEYSDFGFVTEDAQGNFVCADDGYVMLPLLCPYLSKHPDNNPATGPNALNDQGVPAFHDPNDPSSYARGTIVKFDSNGSTIGNDPADTWTVDLAVPCFAGSCAQDWARFVRGLNPLADPDDYRADPRLEHEIFGCDLWVEVTRIY